MVRITESKIEEASLEILSEIGYKILCGPDISPDGENPERTSYGDIVLIDRLKSSIAKLNPEIPFEAQEEAIKKYQNRAIETAQIIEELIELGRKIREESERGKELNLTDDEVAFYDALAENESARQVMGDEKLSIIARELLEMIRNNVTIDWTIRENVQAKIRVMVKRILRKYGYPPDKTKAATELVLDQANVICRDWAESV